LFVVVYYEVRNRDLNVRFVLDVYFQTNKICLFLRDKERVKQKTCI
jgi:hypothetical protein